MVEVIGDRPRVPPVRIRHAALLVARCTEGDDETRCLFVALCRLSAGRSNMTLTGPRDVTFKREGRSASVRPTSSSDASSLSSPPSSLFSSSPFAALLATLCGDVGTVPSRIDVHWHPITPARQKKHRLRLTERVRERPTRLHSPRLVDRRQRYMTACSSFKARSRVRNCKS